MNSIHKSPRSEEKCSSKIALEKRREVCRPSSEERGMISRYDRDSPCRPLSHRNVPTTVIEISIFPFRLGGQGTHGGAAEGQDAAGFQILDDFEEVVGGAVGDGGELVWASRQPVARRSASNNVSNSNFCS